MLYDMESVPLLTRATNLQNAKSKMEGNIALYRPLKERKKEKDTRHTTEMQFTSQ